MTSFMEGKRIDETYKVNGERLVEIISKIDEAYPDTESSRVSLTKTGIEITALFNETELCPIGRLISGGNIGRIDSNMYFQTYSETDGVKPRLVDVLREFII